MPLLCRNCGAVNPDGSTTCSTCQMESNFSPHDTLAETEEKAKSPENAAQNCRNCGHLLNGPMQTACPACGIPMKLLNGELRWSLAPNQPLPQVSNIIFN